MNRAEARYQSTIHVHPPMKPLRRVAKLTRDQIIRRPDGCRTVSESALVEGRRRQAQARAGSLTLERQLGGPLRFLPATFKLELSDG